MFLHDDMETRIEHGTCAHPGKTDIRPTVLPVLHIPRQPTIAPPHLARNYLIGSDCSQTGKFATICNRIMSLG